MKSNFDEAKAAVSNLSLRLIGSFESYIKETENIAVSDATQPAAKAKNSTKQANHTLALIGVCAALTGGIGWISAATWGKWVFFSGLALTGIDVFAVNSNKDKVKSGNNQSTSEKEITVLKRYEIINRLSKISETLEKKWDSELNVIKEGLLEYIKDSNAGENNKVNANYKLYTIQKLSHSMKEWIPRFEAATTLTDIQGLIKEYRTYFISRIEEVCNKQCAIYSETEKLLN